MKVIKKTKDYVVYQKASGRYAVKDSNKKWVNADEKIKILLAEGLIKAVMPAAPVVEEAPVEEVAAEAAPVAEEAAPAVVEETAPAVEEAAPVAEVTMPTTIGKLGREFFLSCENSPSRSSFFFKASNRACKSPTPTACAFLTIS